MAKSELAMAFASLSYGASVLMRAKGIKYGT
jgi:hypothetical protein